MLTLPLGLRHGILSQCSTPAALPIRRPVRVGLNMLHGGDIRQDEKV